LIIIEILHTFAAKIKLWEKEIEEPKEEKSI